MKKSKHLKYDQMVMCVLSRSDVGWGINTVKADIWEKKQNIQVDFHSLVRGHCVKGEVQMPGRKWACEGLCEQSILRNIGLEQQGAKTRLSSRSVKNV